MNKFIITLAAFSVLSACSGDGTNPFTDPGDDGTETEPDDGTPIDGDREMPPGTASPTPDFSIFRAEAQNGDGNGYAQSIAYDATSDTFYVDNLAFDAANEYTRGTVVGSLGTTGQYSRPYAVYESAAIFPDSLTGRPINQFTHRMIYGISPSTNTQFAIVRTGSYVNYGFGGFIYQRSNGVNIPDSGQARYSGAMAGLVDYKGAGRLDYSTADIEIAIDFEDFNESTGLRGDAVRGRITNRRIYDLNGTDITDAIVTRIESENEITLASLPTATFVISPDAMDINGEILGAVSSQYVNDDDELVDFAQGNYYAIVSGENAEEIVGIVVLESELSPYGTGFRDTSGFIVYRSPPS